MRGGAVLGFALLLFTALSVQGAVQLYLNGEALNLSHPTFTRGGELFVPLREFGLWLGAEVASTGGNVRIRWAGGEKTLPPSSLINKDGIYYIGLTNLAALVEAQVHPLGDDIYVESQPVPLNSLEWKPERVTARFSAFVPYIVNTPADGVFRITFYHTTLATAPLEVTVTGGPVRGVSLAPGKLNTAVLTVSTVSGSIPASKRFTTPGFYSVSLSFDHRTRSESQTEISPYVTYHEVTTDLGAGPVEIRYLYIEDWSSHFRIVPAVPTTGVGTLADLTDLARAHRAIAAINANFYDTTTNDPVGLLIVDGTVLSSNYQRRAALGIDLFGRLTFFNPQVKLYLRTQEGKIPIDDVNRPIKGDEIVAFTPGYAGPVKAGITVHSFRIVKVKNDRVVSIDTAPYIAPDRTATLIVGSDKARARLAELSIGDEVNLEYNLDQGDILITEAVSAGPLLVRNGKDVLNPEKESFSVDSYLVRGRAARSLLATDWLGGLILLVVVKDETSVGANFQDLLSILHGLPEPVKNAIAFDGGHSSSLVFKDGSVYREVSNGGKVAVGLLLVPGGR